MARSCVDDDSSAFVRDVLVKLTDNVRFKHKNDCSGLSLLGCGKSVMLDARKVVAVEALLDIDLHNQVGHLYDRFVYNHQLYSGIAYVRSKRHTNHNISFKHPVLTYGEILGLLSIRPSCASTVDISQYCQCSSYNIVMVKPVKASQRMLYKDTDFNVCSGFLVEVEESNQIIALYPSQIQRKCIRLTSENRTYFCPLPYRICDD